MPNDVLSLAGIAFDDYSTPSRLPFGGNQAMVVHHLPGGSRAIDTLGPDEADIFWRGQFFGDNAYATALAIDAIRQSGQVVPLVFGGQYRSVIVARFLPEIRRLPTWVEYRIVCTVYQNPMLGDLSATTSSVDTLVGSDLSFGSGIITGGIGGSGL